MLNFNFLSGLMSHQDWVMIGRLLAAMFLGAIIGFERERAGKVAGLRTYSLVSLGAALLTITSIRLFQIFPSVNGTIGYDYHLVANIVVGIGFIGAGSILRHDQKVAGTTTAAGLWVVSAIGIASGFGLFTEAIATTAIVYLILAGLWAFEKYFADSIRYKGRNG